MFVGRSIQTVASIKRIPLVFEYRTILCSVFKWFESANWIATVLIQISNPVSLLSIAQGKSKKSVNLHRPASTGLARTGWLPVFGKELVSQGTGTSVRPKNWLALGNGQGTCLPRNWYFGPSKELVGSRRWAVFITF